MELIVVRFEEFGQAAMDALGRALAGTERPIIGLPTGSTPVPLYERMAETCFRMPPESRCFALDEYVTSKVEAPGSNATFLRRHWPKHLPPVALPRADAPAPDAEIADYCRQMGAGGGLDIAVLGIGRNGHIAFNEPGSAQDSGCRVVPLTPETREAAGDGWPEGEPRLGMTIGVREIMAARRVILLATGEAKRRVLTDALRGPITSALPASFLQQHPALTVVCDTAPGMELT